MREPRAAGPQTQCERARARTLTLIWLGWAAIMLAFPVFARARFELARPDHAMTWTGDATMSDPHAAQTHGLARIVGPHAAWDSEYYLSIALHGFDDPDMRAVAPGSNADSPNVELKRDEPGWVTMNHAFFPLYPWLMRVASAPLSLMGETPEVTAMLAGVVVSLAGTLGAMLAIADLARTAPDRARAGPADPREADGLRAGFYLLLWPASMFLAQVYTEGLFLGLSFGALAMARRGRWGLAAGLAALACWTRSTGALLIIPFAWEWMTGGGLAALRRGPRVRALATLAMACAPAVAYLAWRAVYGADFFFMESHYFGRDLLAVSRSIDALVADFGRLVDGGPQASAYLLVEFGGAAAGAATSLMLLRREPGLALYGLAILAIALTSGTDLSVHRYVLTIPALFLVTARLGRSPAFDRVWTLAGALGMGVFTIAFSAGFWAG